MLDSCKALLNDTKAFIDSVKWREKVRAGYPTKFSINEFNRSMRPIARFWNVNNWNLLAIQMFLLFGEGMD